VYGVSNKVLAMALAELLLGGDAKRPIWVEAGTVMIAIDTLVHNFLHRTGILQDLHAEHLYGPGCYAPAAMPRLVAPRSSSASPARSTRAASTRAIRSTSRALSSTRFGGFAPNEGSTAATVIVSTTARPANKPTVPSSPAALAWR
jgi:hypothetical protein